MKKLLEMSLSEIYLEYVNNFITIGAMAEYYGVEYNFMLNLYKLSRTLYRKVYDLK